MSVEALEISFGTKLSRSQTRMVDAAARARNESRGEFVRRAVLERAAGNPLTAEVVVVAELLALRKIVPALLYALSQGQQLTPEFIKCTLEQADQNKFENAVDRLNQLKAVQQ